MAENTTIARPYARAAFELAHESGRLEAYSGMLQRLVEVVDNEAMRPLIDSPKITAEQLAGVIIAACGDVLDAQGQNLARLLVANRRLEILPEILERFEELRAEAEGTLDVEVTSVAPLAGEQRERLAATLQARLGREIRLHCLTDEGLIGGAIIRAGDLVIDASVRHRLEKLASALAH